MRADDIIAQIDSTLRDWTVSGDAMRSQPGDETEPSTGAQVWIAPAGTDLHEDGWQPLGAIGELDMAIGEFVIDQEAVAAPTPTVTWDEVREILINVHEERTRRIQQMFEAIRQAFGQLAEPLEQAAEAFQHLPEAVDCDDCGTAPRPRDRPAWQSPYGPPQRRR